MAETAPGSSAYDRLSVHLPASIKKLRTAFFNGRSISNIYKITTGQSNGIFDRSRLTNEQTLVCKYSGSALLSGRPLNSVLILMAGASGSGKSKTINFLFDDKHLLPTSAYRSETSTVTRVQKMLDVTAEILTVHGYLSFIDVPGTFDTNSKNEAVNMASIRKFKKTSRELANRRQLLALFPQSYKVYPNIVLFVVSATDKRMDGPDSFLVKSLKAFQKTADYIDKARNNVIVVLTNVSALPRKQERFLTKLQEIIEIIQKQFRHILGIIDVEVIPVENEPEDNDLEKVGDFYKLPNNQLSHLNLFEAMLRVVDKNNDLLGRLFICWYFGTDCPEKKKKAEIISAVSGADENEIAIAAQDLQELQILSPNDTDTVEMTPCYNFQNLGRGYCPVTEEVKPVSPLACWADGSKIVSIENTKFSIPTFIQAYVNSSNSIHRLSFMERDEYQQHMKQIYGLDAGVDLVVAACSKGRWVNGESGSEEYSLVSLVQEMKLVTFQISNPKEKVFDAAFLEELSNLPEEYNDQTKSQYGAFFSAWGTHMIFEEAAGGAVQLNCTIKQSSLTREQLQNVEAQVSGIFNAIFNANPEVNYSSQMSRLREIGVSNDFLRIDGGSPPPLVTLDGLTPDTLREWTKSVSGAPAELRCSIKLYPYYNLLEYGTKYNSLYAATRDYLGNNLSVGRLSREVLATSRNEISKVGVARVVSWGWGWRTCFPKGAKVTLENGSKVKIEELDSEHQSKLQTLKWKRNSLCCDFDKKSTTFCTFLHNEATQHFRYICLEFDNGKMLTASPGHLIFAVEGTIHQVVKEKQVKHFNVGDRAIYLDSHSNTVKTPKIIKISEKNGIGAYAPLTSTGTLIVDGFLVSSYANTDSFSVADAAMLPLKIWCKIKRKSRPFSSSRNEHLGIAKIGSSEIHPYAKFLISLRNARKEFS